MAKGLGLNRPSLPRFVGLCGAAAISIASIHLAWAAVFNPNPVARATRKSEPNIDLAVLLKTDTPHLKADALLLRPIFAPSRMARQPAPPPEPVEPVASEPPPAPPPIEPPSYIVGGVVITPANRKTLLRTQPRERGQWVGQGETTAEGWRVSAVEHEMVVLDRDGSSFTLPLQRRNRGE